jgi:cell division protease FtsH
MMSYDEFIAQVKADKINRVALTGDRTKAVITQDGQTIEVNLPADQGLVDTLTQNNVDITVQPPPDAGLFWRLTQSLGLPILWMSLPLLLLVILLFGRKFVRR